MFAAPNSTLGGASVACWAVFVLVQLALWPCCVLVVHVAELVYHTYGALQIAIRYSMNKLFV